MESLFDFTNYREHPTRKEYQVYHFTRADQAGFFENLLLEHKIYYERHDEHMEDRTVYYFAIKRIDQKQVEKLNNMTVGQYREKFIPNAGFRWFVILLGGLALVLSVIGYFKSR